MRAAASVTAIGLALWLTAPCAHAVGFGRVANATQLGQPLNFAATVRLEADETIPRECVSAEVTVGENKLHPSQVRVTLEGSSDSSERTVRVTSSALIDEPVVNVGITLGCNSRITRNFVAFIDPPLINMAQTAPAEVAQLPPQRVDSQVAPLIDILQGSNSPPTAPVAAARPERSTTPTRPPRSRASSASTTTRPSGVEVPSEAKAPAERRTGRSNRMAVAPRPAPAGPRLKLEAAPAVAAAASAASAPAETPVDAATVVASAASAVEAAGAQLLKERQRIQALEDNMARINADAQATQKSLAALQARLNQAESERYANPLVYGLAWLSALLALGVAALWWRQSRQRGSSQWWAASQNPPPSRESALEARARRNALLRDPASAPQEFSTGPDVAGAAFAASTQIEPPTATMNTLQPPIPGVTQISLQAEPARELSVEELIDLEQQAEFFIVLGQDEAAIELLMSHVRSDGGISPLPYLKLLEIYRRRGDVEAYQRIRERFNRRFNAYAPDWEADLQHGRSLEDYPAVMQQLESLWPGPERTMACLDGLLFRRKPDDQTFDLPAYRELLFLYSIARDLAELEASRPGADVDLLLPIGEVTDDEPISQVMTSSGELDTRIAHQATQPLDLDVSFGAPDTLPGEDPNNNSGFIDLNDLGETTGKLRKR